MATRVGLEPPKSGSGVRGVNHQATAPPPPPWTDCDEAGDYVVPNVLSPRDLVSRPDTMDETVPHTSLTTNVHNYTIRLYPIIREKKKKEKKKSLKAFANMSMYKFRHPKSHFYIVKQGFTLVRIIYISPGSARHIDCGYSLEPSA